MRNQILKRVVLVGVIVVGVLLCGPFEINPQDAQPQPEQIRYFDEVQKTALKEQLSEEEAKYLIKLKPEYLLPSKDEVIDFSQARDDRKHILLQFNQIPTKAQQEELKNLGVTLHGYVSGNAYTATVKNDTFSHVKVRTDVRGFTEIKSVYKLAQYLYEQVPLDVAVKEDGTILVYVRFYPDVPIEQAKSLLEEVTATYSREIVTSDTGGYLFGQKLAVKVNSADTYSLINILILKDIVQRVWIDWPKETYNADARALSHVDEVHAAPYELTGADVKVGIWDGGGVDDTHQDFADRVSCIEYEDFCGYIEWHATHVAGTLAGSGAGDPRAKGMAPEALIYSAYYDGDVPQEMIDAVAQHGIVLSNNSWGTNVVSLNRFLFGRYDDVAWDWDAIVKETGLIIEKAAGNDRDDPDNGVPFNGEIYDCIPHRGVAKNIITVGAVDDDGTMSPFSGWGPADDGRIKPDLVANGVMVWSTMPGNSYADTITINDTEYEISGTSMSGPVVTGSAALMVELYRQYQDGVDPTPELIKALLLHTASDLGPEGPDSGFGFGLLNVQQAADVLIGSTQPDSSHRIVAERLEDNQNVGYSSIVSPDTPELKLTLVWMDEPGEPYAEQALVNDLDILVESPNGQHYYPFRLTKIAEDDPFPTVATADAANTVDTVEQTVIVQPESGVWQVTITGSHIPVGPQEFALISSGAELSSGRGIVSFSQGKYNLNASTATIYLSDTDLNTDSAVEDNARVSVYSSTQPLPMEVLLEETAADAGIFTGGVSLAQESLPNTLHIAHGDLITVIYEDADDGTGSPAQASDTAVIDGQAPLISNVAVTAGVWQATITWQTDEPTTTKIVYGTHPSQLDQFAFIGSYEMTHSLTLMGLMPNTQYYFAVESTDEAGNTTYDDNNAATYSFSTQTQVILWVDAAGAGDYTNLQSAIEAANPEDEIRIVQGTYTTPSGDIITWIDKDLHIRGGYAQINGEYDPEQNPTILDAQGVEGRRVIYTEGLSVNSELSGVTITGGYLVDLPRAGAGMYNVNSHLRIKDCQFIANKIVGLRAQGGGMANKNSNVTLSNCLFQNNEVEGGNSSYNFLYGGGGMFNWDSNPTLNNCVFDDNKAWVPAASESYDRDYYGGGMANIGCMDLVITNCTFTDNWTDGTGAGAYSYRSPTTLTGCLFAGNTAYSTIASPIPGSIIEKGQGGGMSGGPVTLTDCTFTENKAGGSAGGIFAGSHESIPATLTNCSFIRNTSGSWGGGADITGKAIFTDCTFAENRGGSGGGLHTYKATLTNCSFIGNISVGYGGGMSAAWDTTTLTDCTFTENFSEGYGGGLSFHFGLPTLTNCSFTRNATAGSGGGINAFGCSPILSNCTFTENRSNSVGGIDITFGQESNPPTLTNCSFTKNTGCGLNIHFGSNDISPATLTNCSFIGNTLGGMRILGSAMLNQCIFRNNLGCGIFIHYWIDENPSALTNCVFDHNMDGGVVFEGLLGSEDDTLTVSNCTFNANDNVFYAYGHGIVIDSTGTAIVTNTILWDGESEIYVIRGSSATVTYSNIQGGYEGEGNIDHDPGFVDAENGDLHLLANSPVIDTGTTVDAPEVDLEGNPRPQGSGVDMGAYEHSGTGPILIWVDTAGQGDYTDLQSAIDAASEGDHIRIAQGTYTTAAGDIVNWQDKDLVIRGGYAEVGGEHNPELYPTILDGQGTAGRRVIFTQGLSPEAELSGITIRGGNVTDGSGGGMLNTSSSPTVLNCIIENNNASHYGGGVWNYAAQASFTNCTFRGNTSGLAGGAITNRNCSTATYTNCKFENNTSNGAGAMENVDSTIILEDCSFTSNQGSFAAGALKNVNSTLTLSQCLFQNNQTPQGSGGAIRNYESNLSLTNCLFWSNQAVYGAGIQSHASSFTVTNCTFSNNTASAGGNAIHNSDSSPTIINTILWDGGGEIQDSGTSNTLVTYSDIQGGYPGNLDIDPLFIDPTSGDFHLQETSPVIDVGTSNGAPAEDFDGVPRPRRNGFDIGAYEHLGFAPVFEPIDDYTLNEGEDLRIDVSAADADGDWLTTIEVIDEDHVGILTPDFPWYPGEATAHFLANFGFDESGTYEVTFITRDEFGLEGRESTTITVLDAGNQPPWFVMYPDDQAVTGNWGEELMFEVGALDADNDFVTSTATLANGDPLTTIGASFIDLVSGPRGIGAGRFTWTPSLAQIGVYEVICTATDEHGLAASIPITITVISPPTIEITNPRNGATYSYRNVAFRAIVTDDLTNPADLEVELTLQKDGAASPTVVPAQTTVNPPSAEYPNGYLLVTYTPSSLSNGYYTYTLTVEDVSDNETINSVRFRVYVRGSSGGGGHCFLAGTPITLANGTTKAIEQLKVGDRLMAYDEATGQFKPDMVKHLFVFPDNDEGYLIINGKIKVTPQHRFYVLEDRVQRTEYPPSPRLRRAGRVQRIKNNSQTANRKPLTVNRKPLTWIEAGKLKLGDKLLNQQGSLETIVSIEHIQDTVTVYNLEVNPYHTFIAGGVVVHNAQKDPWGIAK